MPIIASSAAAMVRTAAPKRRRRSRLISSGMGSPQSSQSLVDSPTSGAESTCTVSLPLRDRVSWHRTTIGEAQSIRRWYRLNPEDPIVFVVDDDRRICEALSALLSTFDLRVVTFGSAAEYIAYPKPDVPACLILDVELPDINGLDLQSQTAQENHPQIVFITGHGDIPTFRARDEGGRGRLPDQAVQRRQT